MAADNLNEQETELSPEQRAAVEAETPSLVVSAAAGAGKTRVLVERYLRHIMTEGFRADQLLTITFTRKAAAEMKRRIVDRLTRAGLREQAQVAETGPIQTIHGFCERLLRENALEAGIDPEFEILSEAHAARIMDHAIQEALAQQDDEDSPGAKVAAKMAGRRAFGDSYSPHARLEQAVREALTYWRSSGSSIEELEAIHENPLALLSRWREGLVRSLPAAVRASYEADRSGDSFAARLAAAYKEHKEFPRPKFIRPSLDEDMEAAEDSCGLMQIACEAWRKYERALVRLRSLDFTMLESHAVALLHESEATAERLRQQYPVMLVDEAQDLNPVQHRLLAMLSPKAELFVGDRQQLIYGFRQAEVELFNAKLARASSLRLPKNYRSSEGILAFIDTLFGACWTDYEPMATGTNRDFSGVEMWIQRRQDTALAASWIKELVDERVAVNGHARDIAVLVRSSPYAMELLARLTDLNVSARVSGGTEQFFARLEVRDLANALEALVNPRDDFALAAVLRSPFSGISLDAIVILARAKDLDGKPMAMVEAAQAALEGVLAGPPLAAEDLALLGQFVAWFGPLARYADRHAAWELIGEMFARSPFLENLARRDNAGQRLANARKLLTLAAQEPETGPEEYAERIRQIQTIRHKEGDAPASDEDADEVTIMTIHKSKGLEFPVVVLPDTFTRLSYSVRDVEMDSKLAFTTTKFGRSASMFHLWLAEERQSREEAEEWRVFYVACTRAMEKLCLVVSPGGGDRLGHRVSHFLRFRDVPPPGVRVRSVQGAGPLNVER